MKKFYLFYMMISLLFLVAIYGITITQVSYSRTNSFFNKLLTQAVASNDFTEFIEYQTIAYIKKDQIASDDYTFHFYQSIAQTKTGEKLNQFSMFIVPKSDILYATEIKDPQDKTAITLSNNDTGEILLDTKQDEMYKKYALSFGIHQYGLYYLDYTFDHTINIQIQIVDYQGDSIFNNVINAKYFEEITTLNLGYGADSERIKEVLNLNAFIRPALIKNITIFLVLDIFAVAVIHFIYKWKKR